MGIAVEIDTRLQSGTTYSGQPHAPAGRSRFSSLNLAIGQQTPPVASVLITACSIAKADVWEVTKVNVPFVGVLATVLLLVTYAPIIPLALVEVFYR